ncbi:hypothetical protein FIU94_06950 [Sulfitobacter sp. THAF37]|uniref:DUF4153 domain-containing protein n=1 Tax=Sulfitobacter sp. THAF37 TaxID=2587855 RepID=UPI0012A98136|nr:DUF4173 domain-containing protein [Sulfitobacter sp. THAF37]QFT58564.1 hypothetical protein FIU94_06950 [Sulfitobacter sp. THAF37]
MKTFLIRGVPLAMQQDGWWLNAPADPPASGKARVTRASVWHVALLVAMIALGDALVWQVTPGLSLAVFGAAMVLAAVVTARRLHPKRLGVVVAGSLLSFLPLVELVQPLSLAIAVLGGSVVLAVVAGLQGRDIPRAALRLWPVGMEQTVEDGARALGRPNTHLVSGWARQAIRRWLVPVLLGAVFMLLLLMANPIADRWVADVAAWDPTLPQAERAGFWLCLLPLVWTALRLSAMRERLAAAPARRHAGPRQEGLINPASTVRALVLFNGVFLVQTMLDAIYLYGGVGLPRGITYAEYAHRGAYPLVVTGLLAGGFALLTRRWVQGDTLLRGLLLAWVAQNVALVVSSLVRLDLYVGVYGLTHLRLAAAIWMGMTAVGLALIFWQVCAGRNNLWLMLRGGGLSVAVVYGCAFFSFDAAIARYNLTHPVAQDRAYLCGLGAAARPVIAAAEVARRHRICPGGHRISVPRDWREWGFRTARARNSLAAIQSKAPR